MKRLLFMLIMLLFYGAINAQEVKNEDIRFNQYGKIVDRKPVDAEVRNGIMVFESKDGDYRMWFDIRVQADAQFFSDKALNPIGYGTSIRRARFAVKADLSERWYGEIDLDFANGILELKDAYLKYDFLNGLETRAGNFKERFSMSQNTTSRYLPFMERSMAVNTFVPSRHIGWEVSYTGSKFLAVGGLFFQEIDDAEMRTYVEDNNKDFGRDAGYSLTGKVIYMPFNHKTDYGLHLAYAYSYRTPKSSVAPGEYGSARYSTRSLSSINRKKYLDTDLIPNLSHSTLMNFEAAFYYKGFSVEGEYVMNQTHRNNNLETLNFGGYYVQGSYLLFGGTKAYNKSEGEFTQPNIGKSWGDVELGFRYDYVNLNNKDIYGGAGEGITAGLTFYTNRNVKVQLNYSYVNHDRYATGKGKLFVGHDIEGNLTRDPKKVATSAGKAGDDFGMFGVRFEIDF